MPNHSISNDYHGLLFRIHRARSLLPVGETFGLLKQLQCQDFGQSA
jgi:hypothetical protein